MIKLISVDDRLLHGQIAFYWTQHLKLDTILILNDEAANDEFTKMILGLAKPRDVRLIIDEPEKGLKLLKEFLISEEKVLVIVGNLFDANEISKKFQTIKAINIGGLRNRPNSKVFNERTFLTSEDIAIIKRLIERDIRVTIRHSPKEVEEVISVDNFIFDV